MFFDVLLAGELVWNIPIVNRSFMCSFSYAFLIKRFTEIKIKYPNTRISWIVRKQHVQEAFGGEENDELAAKGILIYQQYL